MENIVTTVFLVMIGGLVMMIVIGVFVGVVNDYLNYKDLQERLKREQERKAKKEKK